MFKAIRLPFAVLIALLAVGCARPAGAVDFETLARGSHSGITGREAVLITDQEQWAAHWARHTAVFVPPPPPPPVDFERASVLALHMGEQRTGGYSVTITAVEREGNELRVTALESRPGPGAVVTMALTQPYHMVRIPRVEPGTQLSVTWKQPGEPAAPTDLGQRVLAFTWRLLPTHRAH